MLLGFWLGVTVGAVLFYIWGYRDGRIIGRLDHKIDVLERRRDDLIFRLDPFDHDKFEREFWKSEEGK